MPELLLATNNPGKVKEYTRLLAGCGYRLVTPADLGISIEVAETGSTFTENAGLKAKALAAASEMLTLADDSGLEVDALGGEPGVRSARYAGTGATDQERNALLLKQLEGVPPERRTARFVCVIAISRPEGNIHLFEGTVEGLITEEPMGSQGFGYDPVFLFPDKGKTMAEISTQEKNLLSHRARAAAKACSYLYQLVD